MVARTLLPILTLVGLAGLAGALYLRAQSVEQETAAGLEPEQQRRESVTHSREKLGGARQVLFEAVDRQLFPTPEEWARAEGLYQEAGRLDAGAIAPRAGQALVRGVRAGLERHTDQMEAWLRTVDSGDEEVLARYLLGWHLLRQGEPGRSWDQFQLVLKSKRDWLPARLGQAWADVESRDAGQACSVFEEALARWPERGDLAAGRARCHDVRSGLDASLLWYARAFELGVRSSDVVEGTVSLLLREDRADEAYRIVGALMDREPFRPDLHFQMGRVHAARDSVTDAAAEYMVAQDQDPTSVDTRLALGALLLRHHRAGQARAHFEAALTLAPEDRDAHVYLGFAQLEQGQRGEAVSSFMRGCRSGASNGCREACLLGRMEACGRLPGHVTARIDAERQAAAERGHGNGFPRVLAPLERPKTSIYAPGTDAVLTPWIG